MKKTLSVILAVILMFSAVSVMAFAEDAVQTEEELITVKFYWDIADLDGGEPKNVVQIAAGENLVEHFSWYDCRPETPVKESTETTKYTFDIWEEYRMGDDGNWIATGNEGYTGTLKLPADAENGDEIIFVAKYYEEEIKENVSFWALIASIFARFNQIFEYFAKVFEGVIEF